MAVLGLKLEADAESVSLRSLVTALDSFSRVLADLETAITRLGGKQGKGNHRHEPIRWVISNLAAGSLYAEILSIGPPEEQEIAAEVAAAVIAGFDRIEEGVSPPYLSEMGVGHAQRLLDTMGRDGINGIEIHNFSGPVHLTAKASSNAAELLRPRHESIGSVEGQIEVISVHKRLQFTVYQSATNKAVRCIFPDTLLDRVKELSGCRVNVSGTVASNARGEPLRVDARDIRPIGKPTLPTIEQIGGSDPDFTAGMTTEEFMRSIRDA